MSVLLISREHIPFGRLSSSLFPVIVNPHGSTSMFILDDIYWSSPLISNFIYRTYAKQFKMKYFNEENNEPQE